MEAARKRVTDEAMNMIESVDKEFLRKMQVDAFKCSIKCCENTSSVMADKDRCLEVCANPMNNAQNLIKEQLNNFQNRLQRCSTDCVDMIKDKASMNVTEEKIDRLEADLDNCLMKCAETHIKFLPDVQKRIINGLSKNQY